MGATKQDKRLKKDKAAKKKADDIVKKAKEKVSVKESRSLPLPSAVSVEYPAAWDKERIEAANDDQWNAAVRVRLLREQGEPWWAIARDLELEGWGSSATTGKKGAARARSLYKAGFGSFPRTFQTGGYKGKAERNERVRDLQKQKKAERMATAKAGRSVIGPDVPDEEVAAMLKGRKIRWYSTEIVSSGFDQEVCIHPTAPFYIEGDGLERVIHFREQHRRAPRDIRWHPAQTRTVLLRQIYSVK